MIVLFLLGAALASAATKADLPAPANAKLVPGYGKLPLHFEPNQGQWDSKVKFASRGPNYGLFLSNTEALMVLHRRKETKTGPVVGGIQPEAELRQDTVRMQLVGASGTPSWSGEQKLPGITNYYLSRATAGQMGVPHYRSARANSVYNGIDVLYYSQNRTLEYDFIVHPGANPAQIRMRWTGNGKIEVNANGDLVIGTALGEVLHQKPLVYQTIAGQRVTVDGKFQLNGDQVQFALGDYDRSRDLVIDPVVRSYSTLLGGTSLDQAVSIAADGNGNAFIGGSTQSPSFPGNAAGRSGTSDAFVTKLNSDGSAILFTTYISGSSTEQVQGLAVDSAGNVYGIGRTQSSNLSGENLSTSFAGGSFDVFLFKLGSTGTINYLRYLGGTGDDFGAAVAVSSSFELYFTGSSNSKDLPGAGTAPSGTSYNAFVGKLNSAGGVSYLRYFGSTADDFGLGIAVDGTGAAYIGGSSSSSGLPITSPLRSYSASVDGFIAKIDPTGANVVWGTYIGGSVIDEVYSIALDGNGNVYAGGYTGSANFPIINTGRSVVGSNDMFVVKINSTPDFVYSTVFGGSGNDWLTGITVDRAGSVYIAGYTQLNLPVTTPFPAFAAPNAAHFSGSGGFGDGIVAKVTPGGRSLLYSMYVGGNGDDRCTAIAVDASGNAYVSGYEDSTGTSFPTVNALSGGTTNQGATDAFVLKIGSYQVPAAAFISKRNAIEVTNFGDDPYSNAALYRLGGDWGDSVAVAQRKSTGDIYVVAKDFFDGSGRGTLYARVFRADTQTWGNWYAAGSITGTPAIAVNESTGTAYVVVSGGRGAQGEVLYYWATLDPNTGFAPNPFVPKLAGGGLFSTDPSMTSCADGNTYVVGKGWAAGVEEQPLWMVRINSSGTASTNWISGGGLLKGKPSITCGTDTQGGFNVVYLAARDKTNNTWAARIAGDSWLNWPATGSPWLSTGGAFLVQDPKVVTSGDGKLFVVAATECSPSQPATCGFITYTRLDQGSTQSISWIPGGTGGFVDNFAPAATNGDLFVAARKADATANEDQFFWWRSSNAATLGNGTWDKVFVRTLNNTTPPDATPK